MRSWSEHFANRVENRRYTAKRPCGFIVTEDGELPLNTEAGQTAFRKWVARERR